MLLECSSFGLQLCSSSRNSSPPQHHQSNTSITSMADLPCQALAPPVALSRQRVRQISPQAARSIAEWSELGRSRRMWGWERCRWAESLTQGSEPGIDPATAKSMAARSHEGLGLLPLPAPPSNNFVGDSFDCSFSLRFLISDPRSSCRYGQIRRRKHSRQALHARIAWYSTIGETRTGSLCASTMRVKSDLSDSLGRMPIPILLTQGASRRRS